MTFRLVLACFLAGVVADDVYHVELLERRVAATEKALRGYQQNLRYTDNLTKLREGGAR